MHHSHGGTGGGGYNSPVRLVRAGTFALTVAKSVTGSGTVSSTPAGITCGSSCTAKYSSGTSVTLTALAASGSSFTGWGGACSGTATTCTVTMSALRSVTVSFSLLLEQGWNLMGNSINQILSVASLFGDPNVVTTVWKWDAANSHWQFYAPSMDATALQTYAAAKGYSVLSQILLFDSAGIFDAEYRVLPVNFYGAEVPIGR